MKLMVGEVSDGTAVFLVEGETATNISAVLPGAGADLMGLINDPSLMSQIANAAKSAPSVDVASVTPAMPVAQPGTIICLGLNYIDHIKEGGYDVPDYPALFMRGRNSMMPAGAPMVRPTLSLIHI